MPARSAPRRVGWHLFHEDITSRMEIAKRSDVKARQGAREPEKMALNTSSPTAGEADAANRDANGAPEPLVNGNHEPEVVVKQVPDDVDPDETKEWLDSLEGVLQTEGPDRARYLLTHLKDKAIRVGVALPFTANTPYINTIPASRQPSFPGNRDLERRIKSLVRWNAMAMVVQANEADGTIGGHIATFASSATLYEIGFNHFFRGPDHPEGQDLVYFQGHASPGMYSRAFLEGRLSEAKL